MAKKKKKRVFKVKNIIILLFVFLGIVFLIYYGLTMPVKNVYISGNEILSDDKIMKISDLYEYPSFLLTSSRDISKNILNDPYVKGVKIHKKFGNVVEIVIQEYRVVCSFGNKILLENGRFLENSYSVMDVPLLINVVISVVVVIYLPFKLNVTVLPLPNVATSFSVLLFNTLTVFPLVTPLIALANVS